MVVSIKLRSKDYGKPYQDSPGKKRSYTGNPGGGNRNNTADAQQI